MSYGRFVDGSVIRARMARKDARVNREIASREAARKAYSLVQLRANHAAEYRAGMDAFDQGWRIDDGPYESGSIERIAFEAGYRQARRDEGE